MHSFVFSLLFAFLVFPLPAQEKIRFYSEQSDEGFVILADNDEYCPVSAEVTLVLTNLKAPEGNKFYCVLPARSAKTEVVRLKTVKPALAVKMSYTTKAHYGDFSLSRYDTIYEYNLPFNKGEKFLISQGYKGKKTHQNENALDFEMPESTEVYAIRNGVVFAVVQKNNRNCSQKECTKYNNYIKVYHSDGTMAEYVHLKKNGSLVQPGDTISKGQHIGYSGNTGYSSGPHLHLVVSVCKLLKNYSIETIFRTGNGNSAEYLKEGKIYSRDY